MKSLIGMLLLSIILFSCNEKSDDGWVVRYKDDVITTTELKEVVPNGLSYDDSLKFVNAYIKNWVKSKVLITERENFLSEEELISLEQKVDKYRKDLTEIMIEDKLILGFSDSVSEEEVKKYYNDFPETFVLKNDILSYRLMVIPSDSLNTYRNLLKNNKIEELQQKLSENKYYFSFKEDSWIEKDKLLTTDLLPEKIKSRNLMVENQILTEKENDNVFLFQTLESGKAGEAAPYEFIKPTIKNVLLNKRKLNLLSQKKNELYEKVLQNDEIKRK